MGPVLPPRPHTPYTTHIPLQKIMVAHLFFTSIFGRYGNKEENYIIHYMLAFQLFMAVPSEDYYLKMKDKYQT